MVDRQNVGLRLRQTVAQYHYVSFFDNLENKLAESNSSSETMFTMTGNQVMEWHVCQRKVWLIFHGVRLEKQSDLVADGKRVQQNAYKRRKKTGRELALPGIKLDFFDPDTQTVYETKRSPALAEAHRWQLKYYLYVLKLHGLGDCTGVLEYPRQKKKETVTLLPEDEIVLAALPQKMETMAAGACPPPIEKRICKSCAFAEFCYSAFDEN